MRAKYDSIESADLGGVSSSESDSHHLGHDQQPLIEAGHNEPRYQLEKWCGIRRSTWLLTIYICSYLGYIVAGAFVIALLETENEQAMRKNVTAIKKNFLLQHPDIQVTELDRFLSVMVKASSNGISVSDDDQDEECWSFGQSLLFIVSVVTTIGYGQVTPLTEAGKLFCILYGLVGIPFTLVFLSASVQRLLPSACQLLAFLMDSKLARCFSALSIRIVHLALFSTIFLVFFVLIPAAVFWILENRWTYLDAVYFIFISLTTIGLGDFIPGMDPLVSYYRDVYQSCVAAYLLIGLVFLTLTLTVFYDIPQLNLGLHLQQHKDIRYAEGSADLRRPEQGPLNSNESLPHLAPAKKGRSSGHK